MLNKIFWRKLLSKNFFFTSLWFFLCSEAFSQTPDTIYYNHIWEKTIKDSAQYFRIAEKKADGLYSVQDFYISGALQMKGTYSVLEPEVQMGYFIWYYESGQKFAEGNYKHGERDGVWTFWYLDGLKKEELEFNVKKGEVRRLWQSRRLKIAMEIISKAKKKNNKGNWLEALKILSEGILQDPLSADLFYERGMLYYYSGKNEKACDDLKTAKYLGFYDGIGISKTIAEVCINGD